MTTTPETPQVPAAPASPATEVGALVHPEHYDKVMSYVEIGKTEGRLVAAAGRSAVYDITVTTDDGTPVAAFRGRSRTIPAPGR